jgi:hypothetical protein
MTAHKSVSSSRDKVSNRYGIRSQTANIQLMCIVWSNLQAVLCRQAVPGNTLLPPSPSELRHVHFGKTLSDRYRKNQSTPEPAAQPAAEIMFEARGCVFSSLRPFHAIGHTIGILP